MPLRLSNWEELSRSKQIPIINLPLNQTYIVTGGPGTGKTIWHYIEHLNFKEQVQIL